MDAIEFLRNDHQQVLAMLDRLERDAALITDGDSDQLRRRRELVTELVIAESQHEAVEEQYFWPAVRDRVPGGDRLADHAVEQEQGAKHVLAQLDGMSADHAEFEELIAKVIDDGREHIAYEQDTVWPRVRETLSAQELAKLGEQLAEAKKIAPTRPHPHTPPSPGVLKTAGTGAALVDKARDIVTGRGQSEPDHG